MSQALRIRLEDAMNQPGARFQRLNALKEILRGITGTTVPRTTTQGDAEGFIFARIQQLEFEENQQFEINQQQLIQQAEQQWHAGQVNFNELQLAVAADPENPFDNTTEYTREGLFEQFDTIASQTSAAISESEAFEIMTVGDAYFTMMWAAEYARLNGVKIQLYVDKTDENITDIDGRVLDEQFTKNNESAMLITAETTERAIRAKANSIILNAMFFYDGEVKSDKRGDYEFRFVVFGGDEDEMPIFVKAGELNCMLQIIYDNIQTYKDGSRAYKVYDKFVNLTKELGEKGFDIKRTAEYLGFLPFDFTFFDRHGVVHESLSTVKNRESRHDIKQLKICIENEHAVIKRLTKSFVSREKIYCGDEEKDKYDRCEALRWSENPEEAAKCLRRIDERNRLILFSFAEFYGLDIHAINSRYPFITADDCIIKTFNSVSDSEALTPNAQNTALFLNGLKKQAGINKKYLNYERYYKRARLTPITYRSTNWSNEIHTKIDGTRMYLQALKKVRVPYDNLEHYNLSLNPKETREFVDMIGDFYGFAFCEYPDRFPGAFRHIWRAAEVYDLQTVKGLAGEGIYPADIKFIAMTRKYHDCEDFPIKFCESLPKGEFNSMIGALFKKRRIRTQAINCEQDYKLFMKHLNDNKFKVISRKKTGVIYPVDSNERHHADRSIKELFYEFVPNPGFQRAEISEGFEQRIIEYKVPKQMDKFQPRGWPALQTAITNIVAFTMCKLENYMTQQGYTVAGVWGDGLTYEIPKNTPANLLSEVRKITGFDFKFEKIPEDNKHLVKTIELEQRAHKKISLPSSVPTKFIYDIETVVNLSSMLLEGPGGSGKTHFLKSLTGELENCIITSSKQKTARDIGGKTVHKVCSYFPDYEKDDAGKTVPNWNAHDTAGDYALNQASYIVLDEVYVSPAECTEKVINSGSLVFYTGDKLQKSLIGEKAYDLPKKYAELGRPLNCLNFSANMRFKRLDGTPHAEHYEMLNELRKFIRTAHDPELIPIPRNATDSQLIKALSAKNYSTKDFIDQWIRQYKLPAVKYNVRNAKKILSDVDKNELTVLGAVNAKIVDQWNQLIEHKIQVGSKVITHDCKENGIIGIVKGFCGGKNEGTPSEYVEILQMDEIKKFRLSKLKLAYSMSVDKSQGSTFSGTVVVDCRNMKDLATFYVALSRAKYPEKIKLVTGRPSK